MKITFENNREQSAMKAIAQLATEHGIGKLTFELGETVITSETRSERGRTRDNDTDRDGRAMRANRDETDSEARDRMDRDNGRTRQTIQRTQYRWTKHASVADIDELISQPETRRVARYLAKNGPASARTISDEANVDYKTVTGAVNTLRHMSATGELFPGSRLPRKALVVSEPVTDDRD